VVRGGNIEKEGTKSTKNRRNSEWRYGGSALDGRKRRPLSPAQKGAGETRTGKIQFPPNQLFSDKAICGRKVMRQA